MLGTRLLFGVGTTHPFIYIVLVVALLGAMLPARQAMLFDP